MTLQTGLCFRSAMGGPKCRGIAVSMSASARHQLTKEPRNAIHEKLHAAPLRLLPAMLAPAKVRRLSIPQVFFSAIWAPGT
jgi:hypothetical protein